MTDDGFKAWLIEKKGFTTASAKDVVSRARRASLFGDICKKIKDEKIIDLLDNNSNFTKLSVFVKPQIKRAALLFREYNKISK